MDPKCCKIEWIGWLNRVHTISLWDWYALELWSVVIGAALRHFVRIEPVVRQLQIYIYIYISARVFKKYIETLKVVWFTAGCIRGQGPKGSIKAIKAREGKDFQQDQRTQFFSWSKRDPNSSHKRGIFLVEFESCRKENWESWEGWDDRYQGQSGFRDPGDFKGGNDSGVLGNACGVGA